MLLEKQQSTPHPLIETPDSNNTCFFFDFTKDGEESRFHAVTIQRMFPAVETVEEREQIKPFGSFSVVSRKGRESLCPPSLIGLARLN